MRRLQTVGARLSFALALVVLLALGVVYAIVVPPLERNLVESKLDQLARSASAEVARAPQELQGAFGVRTAAVAAFVGNAAVATNSRVIVYDLFGESGAEVLADSQGRGAPPGLEDDPVALQAVFAYAPTSGTVERGGRLYAEFAYPLASSNVVLFSAPLEDTLANVELVKRRVLVAGGVALLLALVLGLVAARLFSRRIHRLERAAERIAGGDLHQPVVDRGRDELGQLARAFERMRGRLAQLEHARREFIANASHELRTPIFSLGGFLELLDDEELDEATRRDFLGSMHEQVERLTRLAGDLLDLSRVDAGRLRVEREPVDLGGLASTLAHEFAGIARASSHPLTVSVEEPAPLAVADESRVIRIGRVLVENALRHTPPGTPVEIRVRSAGGAAELSVEDRGGGIPAQHLPHVFERFYRVEGGVASGSGLGLAIALELAGLMGGGLTVSSRPGRTTFTLRLPPASAREPAVPAAATP